MPLKSSVYTEIDPDHLAASAGFPFYGIGWTEKDGRYPWDGSLEEYKTRFRNLSRESHKLADELGPMMS